ncbi:MAG: DNA polymerase III subunit alpha, partial [Flavobacteriales bacterium]
MFLIFDTETTGVPKNYNAPLTDFENWPRVVQIAWQLHDISGKLISHHNVIVRPEGFTIPFNAEKIHGISTQRALDEGSPLSEVLELFHSDLQRTTYVAGHNISFDTNIMGCEFMRMNRETPFDKTKVLDTMALSTDFCAIAVGRSGKFKWPTLTELHQKLFGKPFGDAHDAAYDVEATARCFFGLIEHRVIHIPEMADITQLHYEAPILEASNFTPREESSIDTAREETDPLAEHYAGFVHLHTHSQFSLLQSTADLGSMIKKAKSFATDEFPAVMALTDHANMMGAFQFVNDAWKKEVKAIVGCEFNVCNNMRDRSKQDNGFQIPIIAKTKRGYQNLTKLSSLAFTEGFFYVPRIDKATLLEYSDDLIILSGGIFGEVGGRLLEEGEDKAEEAFAWWHEHFADHFYVELNRHGLDEEEYLNRFNLTLCEKYQVPYVAANSSYYIERNDSQAQDTLVCIKEGESLSTPKKYSNKRSRDFRWGLPNDEYYIKSPEEMSRLFADLPEALRNTRVIADRCEAYKLTRDVLLPKFDIPAEFQDPQDEVDGGKRGENNYLRHLTYVGAKKRYGDIAEEIQQRLDFELATIANTGYPGYFLIVQDFCNKARELGVSVGPGRGSAAGSAVAYCTGITNVDPIRYQLLFERFLNPERVSLPDIDIDFDDEGRDRVIQYVRNKYGANMVSQIITYGTMKGKSAIRDAARVMGLPLPETDKIAKCMPDNTELSNILNWDEKKLGNELSGEDFVNAKVLRMKANERGQEAEVIRLAASIEGSVRNTGIHACGVIITPDEITNYVPVATAKDSDMWCTQFDNSVVESAGLLKMDFLGLKTLTLIKDTIRIIGERHNIDIDIEAIPIDDEKTYQLFQRGHTSGIFQYESDGMQKYMKELKPTVFEDLIAMNALYRPGPLEYIPDFVKRKNGLQPITYDLPEMEEFLKDTYGITVYQEQVMLLSQKLANFSKGEADVLRKAMGKKQKDVLDKMKGKFMEGAKSNGHPE